MTLSQAIAEHETLTRRVREEAGKPGIARLRFRLQDAAHRRMRMELEARCG